MRRDRSLVVTLVGFALLALSCGDVQKMGQQAQQMAQEAKRAALTPSLPCGAPVPEVEPVGCISGELRCGDTVEGTTVGGESNWDDKYYATEFCFPGGDDHGGPERAYLLHAPAYSSIRITLQSDCVDLDIAAMAFNYEGRCPTSQNSIPECEGDAHRGGGTVLLQNFNNPRTYIVGVDGKGRETGPFRLTVECEAIIQRN